MNLTIELPCGKYNVNTLNPWSLAIPLSFNRPQPNHFGAANATAKPMQAGGFVGDTQQGGSCNVNELTLNPHCNGTHTETLAHICDRAHSLSLSISNLSIPPFMPCALVSVEPKSIESSQDSYTPPLVPDDRFITREALEKALQPFHANQLQAVVIRTLPNLKEKTTQQYNASNPPPFLSEDAVLLLNELGTEHLVLDVPSLDRMHDDGVMSCHHLFWQVPTGSHQPTQSSLINKSLTEMAFIDEQIEDGFYFLSLQTPAFDNDAAPSRPVIYPAIEQP